MGRGIRPGRPATGQTFGSGAAGRPPGSYFAAPPGPFRAAVARVEQDAAAMYYKFSGFTQKLVGAWASDAYNPQV